MTNALVGQDIIFVPELISGNWQADLQANGGAAVITSFVNSGGGLISIAFQTGAGRADNLLNSLFGFAITQNCCVTSGTGIYDAVAGMGTAFEGGPATLSLLTFTVPFTSLPMGSKCIYFRDGVPGQTVANLIPFGAGNITYLGWDWNGGGPGCSSENADWNDVLNRATMALTGPPSTVPTMGEWGLIILALLVLSFATVFMMRRQTAIAGMGEVSMSQSSGIPFDKSSFGKMLASVMIGLVAVFAVAVLVFGYEMTNADVPGSLIAGPIAAYLLHLLFGKKK